MKKLTKVCLQCPNIVSSYKHKFCQNCQFEIEQKYSNIHSSRYSNKGQLYDGPCLLCNVNPVSPKRRLCASCVKLIRSREFMHLIKSVGGDERTCIDCGSTNIINISRCSPCHAAFMRYRTYGITKEQFNIMRKSQNYCCLICLKHENDCRMTNRKSTSSGLVVDHCHVTGTVRGLLCQRCNSILGWFNDDPQTASRAAKYLEGTRRLQET